MFSRPDDEESRPFVTKDEAIIYPKSHSRSYVIIGLTMSILFVLASFAYISVNKNIIETLSMSKQLEKSREVFLFGDSLVGVPDAEFGMSDSIQKTLQHQYPDYDTEVNTYWGNGFKVKTLLDSVDREVIIRDGRPAPDAVIVLFDSDAADVKETDKNKVELRLAYTNNLRKLLNRLTSSVSKVALSGPILRGELRDGSNVQDSEVR